MDTTIYETYLKKHGFTKARDRDMWWRGTTPNMHVVSLIQEVPHVYLSTGTTEQTPEDCGVSAVMDVKNDIMAIYESYLKTQNKKPAETGTKPPASQQVAPIQDAPPKPELTPTAPPAGESHKDTETKQYSIFCYNCQTGITAEQRTKSVKLCNRALCEKCTDSELVKKNAKENIKPADTKVNNNMDDNKNIPVPANTKSDSSLAVMTDHEREQMIEKAKTKRFLQNQSGTYKVSGKERPDSAAFQNIANETGISTEVLFAEQTDNYAHVVVRGHLGNVYIDDAVHHDFKLEFKLKTLEIIERNPKILDHFEGMTPIIKDGATIIKKTDNGDVYVDAKYYLIHALLSFQKFSLRDAITKATARVHMKLLNRDAREPEEVQSEQDEGDLVEKQKKNRI